MKTGHVSRIGHADFRLDGSLISFKKPEALTVSQMTRHLCFRACYGNIHNHVLVCFWIDFWVAACRYL